MLGTHRSEAGPGIPGQRPVSNHLTPDGKSLESLGVSEIDYTSLSNAIVSMSFLLYSDASREEKMEEESFLG